MPIMTYGGFKRMTSFCKTAIPDDIAAALEGIKDNDEAVKAYGIELGTSMCRRLLDAGTPGLHMYTLNLETAAVGILENLGLINKSQVRLFSLPLPALSPCSPPLLNRLLPAYRSRARCPGGRRRRASAARSRCGPSSGATGRART